MKKSAFIAAALLCTAQAFAEQKYGVEVYPNAKFDAAVTQSVAKMGVKSVGTYRTADPLRKVVDFYRGQKLKQEAADDEGATFTMGKAVTVTVQNPWLDMKTGAVMNDTLISIVKK